MHERPGWGSYVTYAIIPRYTIAVHSRPVLCLTYYVFFYVFAPVPSRTHCGIRI